MLEVDDSQLTQDHRDFIEKWAQVLGVSVRVLLGRILVLAIEGEIYCEKVPRE
jgi:hypothetical protein